MFNSLIPTLRVLDSFKSEELLKQLGFETIWEHQDGDDGPRFLELKQDNVSLFLSEHEGDGPFGIFLYFVVDDAKQLFEKVKSMDVTISVELHLTEWDHHMFEICDFDNNTLRFGSANQ